MRSSAAFLVLAADVHTLAMHSSAAVRSVNEHHRAAQAQRLV